MSKRLIVALLLVALSVVLLILNNSDSGVTLNLFTYVLKTKLVFALLGAEVLGVVVGLFLK
jgi:uncharacterized integral membrane protein